jgi:hypothetical protein
MELDAAQYISISGSGSKGFKNLINQIFIDRFNAFVNTTVAQDKDYSDLSQIPYEHHDSPMLNIYAFFCSGCEIISQLHQTVSVIQDFVYEFGRFGNIHSRLALK